MQLRLRIFQAKKGHKCDYCGCKPTKHEDPSSYLSIDGESHKEFNPSDEDVEVVVETLESIEDIPPTSIQGIDSIDNVDTSVVIGEEIEEVKGYCTRWR